MGDSTGRPLTTAIRSTAALLSSVVRTDAKIASTSVVEFVLSCLKHTKNLASRFPTGCTGRMLALFHEHEVQTDYAIHAS